MRWTITLTCSQDDGTTVVVEVATIARGRSVTAGDVGLQLAEAKQITARLQQLVMTEQLRQHCATVRRCAACDRRRPLKDYRRRQIDTVLGRVVVRAPRFRACRCAGVKVFLCPVSELFPTRTTPELRHLQVTLGANLSYRRAASYLRQFLPDATCFNHTTGAPCVVRPLSHHRPTRVGSLDGGQCEQRRRRQQLVGRQRLGHGCPALNTAVTCNGNESEPRE